MEHRDLSVRSVGAWTIDNLLRLGYAARFIARTIMSSGTSLMRPRLVIRELYYTGVLSLIIILVSGLFVGMVLGFQGYHTLQTVFQLIDWSDTLHFRRRDDGAGLPFHITGSWRGRR